jgi:hypothetical protein
MFRTGAGRLRAEQPQDRHALRAVRATGSITMHHLGATS